MRHETLVHFVLPGAAVLAPAGLARGIELDSEENGRYFPTMYLYPPGQKAASFSLDQVMEKPKKGLGNK